MRKRKLRLKKNRQLQTYVLAAMISSSCVHTYSLPTGGSVVDGQAGIVTNNNYMQINQTTNQALINWQTFNIGGNEHVHFNQPGVNSLTINRINPANGASSINGRLSATGNIFLLNPAGVLFGQGAKVDLAGIMTSTSDINMDAYYQGKFVFEPNPMYQGSVVNHGTITLKEKGFAAFVAPHVVNSGVINASLGHVELTGAEYYTVDLYGDNLINFKLTPDKAKRLSDKYSVEHYGNIYANGGYVAMTTADVNDVVSSVINMDGVIQANTVYESDGRVYFSSGKNGKVNIASKAKIEAAKGKVEVRAKEINLAQNSVIDVSSNTADGNAGEVLIGGNYQGELFNEEKFNAQLVTMEQGASIFANADQNGDGGKVILWSDDVTNFGGSIQANSGSLFGDGGFIETSGKFLTLLPSAEVSAASLNSSGDNGQWLLDPIGFTIDNTAAGTFNTTLLTTDVLVDFITNSSDPEEGIARFTNTTPISWNTSSNFEVIADYAIFFEEANQLVSTGNGNIKLRSGTNRFLNAWSSFDGFGGVFAADSIGAANPSVVSSGGGLIEIYIRPEVFGTPDNKAIADGVNIGPTFSGRAFNSNTSNIFDVSGGSQFIEYHKIYYTDPLGDTANRLISTAANLSNTGALDPFPNLGFAIHGNNGFRYMINDPSPAFSFDPTFAGFDDYQHHFDGGGDTGAVIQYRINDLVATPNPLGCTGASAGHCGFFKQTDTSLQASNGGNQYIKGFRLYDFNIDFTAPNTDPIRNQTYGGAALIGQAIIDDNAALNISDIRVDNSIIDAQLYDDGVQLYPFRSAVGAVIGRTVSSDAGNPVNGDYTLNLANILVNGANPISYNNDLVKLDSFFVAGGVVGETGARNINITGEIEINASSGGQILVQSEIDQTIANPMFQDGVAENFYSAAVIGRSMNPNLVLNAASNGNENTPIGLVELGSTFTDLGELVISAENFLPGQDIFVGGLFGDVKGTDLYIPAIDSNYVLYNVDMDFDTVTTAPSDFGQKGIYIGGVAGNLEITGDLVFTGTENFQSDNILNFNNTFPHLNLSSTDFDTIDLSAYVGGLIGNGIVGGDINVATYFNTNSIGARLQTDGFNFTNYKSFLSPMGFGQLEANSIVFNGDYTSLNTTQMPTTDFNNDTDNFPAIFGTGLEFDHVEHILSNYRNVDENSTFNLYSGGLAGRIDIATNFDLVERANVRYISTINTNTSEVINPAQYSIFSSILVGDAAVDGTMSFNSANSTVGTTFDSVFSGGSFVATQSLINHTTSNINEIDTAGSEEFYSGGFVGRFMGDKLIFGEARFNKIDNIINVTDNAFYSETNPETKSIFLGGAAGYVNADTLVDVNDNGGVFQYFNSSGSNTAKATLIGNANPMSDLASINLNSSVGAFFGSIETGNLGSFELRKFNVVTELDLGFNATNFDFTGLDSAVGGRIGRINANEFFLDTNIQSGYSQDGSNFNVNPDDEDFEIVHEFMNYSAKSNSADLIINTGGFFGEATLFDVEFKSGTTIFYPLELYTTLNTDKIVNPNSLSIFSGGFAGSMMEKATGSATDSAFIVNAFTFGRSNSNPFYDVITHTLSGTDTLNSSTTENIYSGGKFGLYSLDRFELNSTGAFEPLLQSVNITDDLFHPESAPRNRNIFMGGFFGAIDANTDVTTTRGISISRNATYSEANPLLVSVTSNRDNSIGNEFSSVNQENNVGYFFGKVTTPLLNFNTGSTDVSVNDVESLIDVSKFNFVNYESNLAGVIGKLDFVGAAPASATNDLSMNRVSIDPFSLPSITFENRLTDFSVLDGDNSGDTVNIRTSAAFGYVNADQFDIDVSNSGFGNTLTQFNLINTISTDELLRPSELNVFAGGLIAEGVLNSTTGTFDSNRASYSMSNYTIINDYDNLYTDMPVDLVGAERFYSGSLIGKISTNTFDLYTMNNTTFENIIDILDNRTFTSNGVLSRENYLAGVAGDIQTSGPFTIGDTAFFTSFTVTPNTTLALGYDNPLQILATSSNMAPNFGTVDFENYASVFFGNVTSDTLSWNSSADIQSNNLDIGIDVSKFDIAGYDSYLGGVFAMLNTPTALNFDSELAFSSLNTLTNQLTDFTISPNNTDIALFNSAFTGKFTGGTVDFFDASSFNDIDLNNFDLVNKIETTHGARAQNIDIFSGMLFADAMVVDFIVNRTDFNMSSFNILNDYDNTTTGTDISTLCSSSTCSLNENLFSGGLFGRMIASNNISLFDASFNNFDNIIDIRDDRNFNGVLNRHNYLGGVAGSVKADNQFHVGDSIFFTTFDLNPNVNSSLGYDNAVQILATSQNMANDFGQVDFNNYASAYFAEIDTPDFEWQHSGGVYSDNIDVGVDVSGFDITGYNSYVGALIGIVHDSSSLTPTNNLNLDSQFFISNFFNSPDKNKVDNKLTNFTVSSNTAELGMHTSSFIAKASAGDVNLYDASEFQFSLDDFEINAEINTSHIAVPQTIEMFSASFFAELMLGDSFNANQTIFEPDRIVSNQIYTNTHNSALDFSGTEKYYHGGVFGKLRGVDGDESVSLFNSWYEHADVATVINDASYLTGSNVKTREVFMGGTAADLSNIANFTGQRLEFGDFDATPDSSLTLDINGNNLNGGTNLATNSLDVYIGGLFGRTTPLTRMDLNDFQAVRGIGIGYAISDIDLASFNSFTGGAFGYLETPTLDVLGSIEVSGTSNNIINQFDGFITSKNDTPINVHLGGLAGYENVTTKTYQSSTAQKDIQLIFNNQADATLGHNFYVGGYYGEVINQTAAYFSTVFSAMDINIDIDSPNSSNSQTMHENNYFVGGISGLDITDTVNYFGVNLQSQSDVILDIQRAINPNPVVNNIYIGGITGKLETQNAYYPRTWHLFGDVSARVNTLIDTASDINNFYAGGVTGYNDVQVQSSYNGQRLASGFPNNSDYVEVVSPRDLQSKAFVGGLFGLNVGNGTISINSDQVYLYADVQATLNNIQAPGDNKFNQGLFVGGLFGLSNNGTIDITNAFDSELRNYTVTAFSNSGYDAEHLQAAGGIFGGLVDSSFSFNPAIFIFDMDGSSTNGNIPVAIVSNNGFSAELIGYIDINEQEPMAPDRNPLFPRPDNGLLTPDAVNIGELENWYSTTDGTTPGNVFTYDATKNPCAGPSAALCYLNAEVPQDVQDIVDNIPVAPAPGTTIPDSDGTFTLNFATIHHDEEVVLESEDGEGISTDELFTAFHKDGDTIIGYPTAHFSSKLGEAGLKFNSFSMSGTSRPLRFTIRSDGGLDLVTPAQNTSAGSPSIGNSIVDITGIR